MKCWVKSRNERNPYPCLPASHVGNSRETAGDKPEEGGDDVKSSWPLCPGLQTCYNGYYRVLQYREVELIMKDNLSSDCRLQLAYMKLESLVIGGQLHSGEFVPEPCTHRPSSHERGGHPKSLSQPPLPGVRGQGSEMTGASAGPLNPDSWILVEGEAGA